MFLSRRPAKRKAATSAGSPFHSATPSKTRKSHTLEEKENHKPKKRRGELVERPPSRRDKRERERERERERDKDQATPGKRKRMNVLKKMLKYQEGQTIAVGSASVSSDSEIPVVTKHLKREKEGLPNGSSATTKRVRKEEVPEVIVEAPAPVVERPPIAPSIPAALEPATVEPPKKTQPQEPIPAPVSAQASLHQSLQESSAPGQQHLEVQQPILSASSPSASLRSSGITGNYLPNTSRFKFKSYSHIPFHYYLGTPKKRIGFSTQAKEKEKRKALPFSSKEKESGKSALRKSLASQPEEDEEEEKRIRSLLSSASKLATARQIREREEQLAKEKEEPKPLEVNFFLSFTKH